MSRYVVGLLFLLIAVLLQFVTIVPFWVGQLVRGFVACVALSLLWDKIGTKAERWRQWLVVRFLFPGTIALLIILYAVGGLVYSCFHSATPFPIPGAFPFPYPFHR